MDSKVIIWALEQPESGIMYCPYVPEEYVIEGKPLETKYSTFRKCLVKLMGRLAVS